MIPVPVAWLKRKPHCVTLYLPPPVYSDMPADVWQLIVEFVQSPALSHVCQSTWSALKGQHVSSILTRDNMFQGWMTCMQPLQSLNLRGKLFADLEMDLLSTAMARTTVLKYLHLNFSGNQVCIHVCTYMCVCTCVGMCVCMYVCMNVCTYVCTYACVCVYVRRLGTPKLRGQQ